MVLKRKLLKVLHEAIVELLLSLGARVDTTNDAGLTSLHKACQFNAPAVCFMRLRIITHSPCQIAGRRLDAGANVNQRDASGNTSLHFCCANGHGACAQLLLSRGADANAANARGGASPVWCVRCWMSGQGRGADQEISKLALGGAQACLQSGGGRCRVQRRSRQVSAGAEAGPPDHQHVSGRVEAYFGVVRGMGADAVKPIDGSSIAIWACALSIDAAIPAAWLGTSSSASRSWPAHRHDWPCNGVSNTRPRESVSSAALGPARAVRAEARARASRRRRMSARDESGLCIKSKNRLRDYCTSNERMNWRTERAAQWNGR